MMNLGFVIIIGWMILVIGFMRRDYTITSLASLFLMILGIEIIIHSGLSPLLSLGFGTLHIGIGFYVLFRSGTETYKGKKFILPKKRKGVKKCQKKKK